MILSQQHHRKMPFSRLMLISLCGFLYFFGQVSYAEAEIYGTLKYDIQYSKPQWQQQPPSNHHYQDREKSDATTVQKKRSQSNIQHQDSHIGIKGQKEIGNGNAIIYQFEWGNDQ